MEYYSIYKTSVKQYCSLTERGRVRESEQKRKKHAELESPKERKKEIFEDLVEGKEESKINRNRTFT